MRTAAGFVHHHPAIATVILVLVLLYATHHGRHYRRHRRAGLNVWVSAKGPWGTRVSRRF